MVFLSCVAVTSESKWGSAEKQRSFQRKAACFGHVVEEFFIRLSERVSVVCEIFAARGFQRYFFQSYHSDNTYFFISLPRSI